MDENTKGSCQHYNLAVALRNPASESQNQKQNECAKVLSGQNSFSHGRKQAMRRIYGVIKKLKPTYGIIEPDPDSVATLAVKAVSFHKSCLKSLRGISSLKKILYVGLRIGVDVVPTNNCVFWKAESVFLESDTYEELVKRKVLPLDTTETDGPGLVQCLDYQELNTSSLPLTKLCSKTEKIDGVITGLFITHGFIKLRTSEMDVGDIFFHFRTIKNIPSGKTACEILRIGQKVEFMANQCSGEGVKGKWQVTEVWLCDVEPSHLPESTDSKKKLSCVLKNASQLGLSDMANGNHFTVKNGTGFRDPQTCQKALCDTVSLPWSKRVKKFNQVGKMYAYSDTEAKIKCQTLNGPVITLSEVVYMEGKNVPNLKCDEICDGVDVIFNAVSDVECPAGFLWKATLVSVGNVMIKHVDAAFIKKMWDALIRDYRSTDIVQKYSKIKSASSKCMTERQATPESDVECDDVLYSSSSDSEIEAHSEVLYAEHSCTMGIIKSVQPRHLLVLVNGFKPPIIISWSIIFVNGRKVEGTVRHLNQHFKKYDMINIQLKTMPFISDDGGRYPVSFAWLGLKPNVAESYQL